MVVVSFNAEKTLLQLGILVRFRSYIFPKKAVNFIKTHLFKRKSHVCTIRHTHSKKLIKLLPHWVCLEGRFHVLSSRHQYNLSDCTLRICMVGHSPVQRWTVP